MFSQIGFSAECGRMWGHRAPRLRLHLVVISAKPSLTYVSSIENAIIKSKVWWTLLLIFIPRIKGQGQFNFQLTFDIDRKPVNFNIDMIYLNFSVRPKQSKNKLGWFSMKYWLPIEPTVTPFKKLLLRYAQDFNDQKDLLKC